MNIIASFLSLAIAIYGFLFIVGGPRLANQWPEWLSRRLGMILRWLTRALMDSSRGIGVSVIRFVFYRPRR
jgi:hypothetical protein